MVRHGDSSDSEEERTDRFKNERNITSSNINSNLLINTSLSTKNQTSYSQSYLYRNKLCSVCSRNIALCLCARTNYRDSPRTSPFRDRVKERDVGEYRDYSYKKRSLTEEYSSSIYRTSGERVMSCDIVSDSLLVRGSSSSRCTSDFHNDDYSITSKSYWQYQTSKLPVEKKCKKKLKKEKRKEEESSLKKEREIDVSETEDDVVGGRLADDLTKHKSKYHNLESESKKCNRQDEIKRHRNKRKSEDSEVCKKEKQRKKEKSQDDIDSYRIDEKSKKVKNKKRDNSLEKDNSRQKNKDTDHDDAHIDVGYKGKSKRVDAVKSSNDETDLDSKDKIKEDSKKHKKSKFESKSHKRIVEYDEKWAKELKSPSKLGKDNQVYKDIIRKEIELVKQQEKENKKKQGRSGCENESQSSGYDTGTKEIKGSRKIEEREDQQTDNYGPSLPSSFRSANKLSHENDDGRKEYLYGPVLPSQKERKNSNDDKHNAQALGLPSSNEDDTYGPSLPTSCKHDAYGPYLPTSSKDKSYVSKDCTYGPSQPSSSRDNDSCGSKLPENQTFGPSLPPSSSRVEKVRPGSSLSEEKKQWTHNDRDSDDSDTVGPLPEGSSLTPSQILLQHRANLLKLHSLNKVDKETDGNKKREEWMTELPDKHRSGVSNVLVARTFKTKVSDATVDLSWTDTPEEKLRKEALASIGHRQRNVKEDLDKEITKRRDKHMEKLVKQNKKHKSDKSLLELHQEKLHKQKKKAKQEGKTEERRPFNRETDLSLTRLTQSQKQSIYKKASQLDDRFSSGRAKYL